MRITLRHKYKVYPLSEELTKKSQAVGTRTHPLFGMVYGAFAAYPFLMISPGLMPVAIFLPIVGAILTVQYRKKKFAQFDKEYEKILEAHRKNMN